MKSNRKFPLKLLMRNKTLGGFFWVGGFVGVFKNIHSREVGLQLCQVRVRFPTFFLS